jgi:hypothetical protein
MEPLFFALGSLLLCKSASPSILQLQSCGITDHLHEISQGFCFPFRRTPHAHLLLL